MELPGIQPADALIQGRSCSSTEPRSPNSHFMCNNYLCRYAVSYLSFRPTPQGARSVARLQRRRLSGQAALDGRLGRSGGRGGPAAAFLHRPWKRVRVPRSVGSDQFAPMQCQAGLRLPVQRPRYTFTQTHWGTALCNQEEEKEN